MKKKVLIGVAWPYVNGDLHLGHLSGYLLPADIFARYQRQVGNDVLMVSGSDCHGTPITVAADKEAKSPKEIVDIYHKKDIDLFKQYCLSFNIYTKTTTENHKKTVQNVFLDLLKQRFIVKDVMKQYFSEVDKKFLPDRYVEGECPHCGAKEQRSDQCEACGRWLKDGELISPVSKLTGSPVSLKDTEHYFLDFPKLENKLKGFVESRKTIWKRWVWQETDSWLSEGLQKRAITRDMDWAVELPIEEIKKLPEEFQLSDFTGKHIYVWFEAVIGYLSGAIEWSDLSTSNAQPNDEIIYSKLGNESTDWKDWWLNPEAKIYNFMGQDNLVFHTLMWPGILAASSSSYTLPYNVVVNKFMNYEGKKFSKSRNWTIDSKLVADRYGVDLIRYYIASNLPENKEASFTWEEFVASVNNELVANLGNLINRTLKFFESKFSGKIDYPLWQINPDVQKEIESVYSEMSLHLDKCEFVPALERLMQFTRFGNKFFDESKIWEVIKSDPDSEKAVGLMLDELNIVFQLITLMEPFVPNSAVKLSSMLSKQKAFNWGPEYLNQLKLTKTVEIIFNKLEPEKVLAERDVV